MSKDNVLPPEWVSVKMGEVFTIERGGSPRPIDEFITDEKDGINWIKIGDTKNVTKYIFQTREKIKPAGVARSRMVYEDDFILSNSMSFGRPYIMKTTGCIHDGWLVIRKSERVDNDFLYYSLSSPIVFRQFTNLAKGSTVKNLNIEAVKQVELAIPPKATQLEIVSKIEELFSEIDKGIETLRTAQQQLKVYRQAVLKWAFEGKLTNEPGKDGELPEGWKKFQLYEITKFLNGDRSKNYPNRNEYVEKEKGVAFINTGHIEPNGKLDYQSMNYITRDKLNSLNGGKIEKGDLVYCLRGATIGKIAFVDQFEEGTVASSLVIIRPLQGQSYVKYIYHYLRSPFGQACIKQFDNGTAQPNLSAKSLSLYLIPIPSKITEQYDIVQSIESRLSVADKMEENITQSVQQSEALKQSILKQAFEGKLM